MAEFILIFPVFFLSIIGIIEFGRAVMVQQIVTNAAREGARRAVVPEATNAQVLELVDRYLVNASLGADSREIKIQDENGQDLDLRTAPPHSVVQVRTSVPYSEVGFGIYTYFANSAMSAAVQMRKE